MTDFTIKNIFVSNQYLRAWLVALLFVLSSVCSLLISPSAKAASDYGIHVTDSLTLGGVGASGSCPTHDLSASWAEIMSTNTENDWSYKNSRNYVNNIDNARSKLDSFQADFSDTLSTGSGWAVQQIDMSEAGAAGQKGIRIGIFESNNTITIQQNNLHWSASPRWVSFYQNPNANCQYQAWQIDDTGSNINPSEASPIFLIASDNVVYPSDYTGPQIPESHNQKSDFYVPYILNVDDKNITVTPKPVDTGGKCWKWASTLVKKGSSTSENFAEWEVIAETDYLESNAPAQLRAREYGNDYAIGMMAYDCDAPAVKISDFYNLKLERIFPLKIDGSSYVLDSANLNCENQGLCEEPTPYEDCASYGVDLIGGLGCVMRNFGVFLRSLFITLFVPSPGFFKDYFGDFKSFIDTKFGFLIWPLTFAIDFVNAFFNGVNGTNNICNWSFGNLFNSDFKLNFCSLEQNFPSAFNTARYMIQAFTVFVLISGLYTHYRRLLKT